jgi:hypothetical protein
MAPMAGLVAALPNIVNPLLESPLTRWYLMPTAGDGSGTGKIMQVRSYQQHVRVILMVLF